MPTNPRHHEPERAAQWATIRTVVGARIRAVRLERGLTQEEVALASGVARHMLVQVERGQRGLLYERLFDIAAALSVPVSALLDDR